MPYFIQLLPDGRSVGAWEITHAEAIRLGVTNAKHGVNSYFVAEGELSAFEVMKARATFWFEPPYEHRFVQTTLNPGEYYPRIARPRDAHPQDSPGISPIAINISMTATVRGQIATLMRRLARICEVVHPAGKNLRTFGHEIRNLLILACTEVESQWRAVLEINSYYRDRYSTNDYVKLVPAMRLNEYAIEFSDYIWLPAFRPFEQWGSTGKPSQELFWYDAYNQTKHDREGQFHVATLEAVFHAVAACVAMACAQYGTHEALGHGELKRTVYPVEVPKWSAADVYMDPYGHHQDDWQQVPYPFA